MFQLENIIYQNKDLIENVYNKENDFEFNFDPTTKCFTTDGTDPSSISMTNIAKFFNLDNKVISKVIEGIKSSSQKMRDFRRLRQRLLSVFDHPKLREIGVPLKNFIENYIQTRFKGRELYILRILTTMDDYNKRDGIDLIITESDACRLFSFNPDFFYTFKKETSYESYTKYFNFLTTIDLGGDAVFGKGFANDILDLIIEHLIQSDLLKNSEAGKRQVKAIVKTLSALTKVRYNLEPDRSKYTLESSPFGIYTLLELSKEISGINEKLISVQLMKQRSTPQFLSLGGLLRRGMDLGLKTRERCSIAIEAIKDYFAFESFLSRSDFQGVGYVFHDIYESLVYRYLESKGLESDFEVELSPFRKFRVDTLIQVDENCKNLLKKQLKINIPEGIKQIVIDYTFSSDGTLIKDKLFKTYQSDDRFLLIVLLGEQKASRVTSLQNTIDRMKNSDIKNKNHLDHVNVIKTKDLWEILGVDGFFQKILEQVDYLSRNIFDSELLNRFTKDIWKYSRYHLASIREEQLLEVF